MASGKATNVTLNDKSLQFDVARDSNNTKTQLSADIIIKEGETATIRTQFGQEAAVIKHVPKKLLLNIYSNI